MKKVRLGIIGAGNMGSGHIGNYLKGLLPEIEIVAVADRRPDRRDWARENLGDKVAIFNEGSDLIASGLVEVQNHTYNMHSYNGIETAVREKKTKATSSTARCCMRMWQGCRTNYSGSRGKGLSLSHIPSGR